MDLEDNPFSEAAMRTSSAVAAAVHPPTHAVSAASGSATAASAILTRVKSGSSLTASPRPSAASLATRPSARAAAGAGSPAEAGSGAGGGVLTVKSAPIVHVPVPEGLEFGPPELPPAFVGKWRLDHTRSDSEWRGSATQARERERERRWMKVAPHARVHPLL